MRNIKILLNGLYNLPIFIGGVAVLALMSLASINVCLRIIQMPYRGTYEIVAFLGAIVTAFALGDTQRRKSHIVVDILSDRYPSWLKKIVDAVGYIVSTAFFLIISWVIFRWGKQIAASGEVSETLKIIYYPFVYLVALGFVILSITLFMDFINTFSKKENGERS
jgi:TRAP-type C4-dicarboxylate transport system permease small subunit